VRVIVLDTETTGTDPAADHVVQICIRDLEDEENVQLWNVRPPIPIPKHASDVHGITDDAAFRWPSFGEIADDIAKILNKAEIIIGYNPDFDVKMLQREFQIAVVEVQIPKTIICCKRLWDKHDPKRRALIDAFKEFVSPEGFVGAHGALADTLATAQVFRAQLVKFGLVGKPYEELDPERSNWYGPSHHVVWKNPETKDVLVMNFGKHQGKPFSAVDVGYLNFIESKDFPKHVRDLCAQTKIILRRKLNALQTDETLASWARSQL
jgi:DNA polymerase-3 subunit epsilon